MNIFRLFPHVDLENTLPGIPRGNETAWIMTRPPEHPADLLSRRFRGGGVIRLSLGELLLFILPPDNVA